ncbi:UNVERIFIED_CONTAM: hypothetical protein GTU68_057400 [Idotea baltica]|nr:hypothetical protein [Idotea baltica]
MAMIFSLIISLLVGKRIINFLRSRLIGETIRTDGPESHKSKAGTPTMGGIIIFLSIMIPTLLWADLSNAYVLLILLATAWMFVIGFMDDYIKVFKKDKGGLKGKFKVVGQVGLGLIVGMTMVFHPDFAGPQELAFWEDEGGIAGKLIYVLIVIFIVTAVSNGVNLTDGLDGLAGGTTAIAAVYLNISYIPNASELTIYCAALIGGCVGFLWYNTHPAQVFMGDTGSLMLGGAIGVLSMMVKKELLIPIFCGIFLIESLSVILQVAYFKYTKKKTGTGKRIFLMAPLHHHYEKKGFHETKIVVRFWIVAVLLAVLAFVTLKLR